MPSRSRTTAANLALALASVALTLLFLEVVARLARAGRGGGKEGREEALYVEPDPLLGWRKRPGGRAVYRRREYTTEVVVNGLGMRDVERSREKPPGTYRVLALGDSFLEAYSVSLEEQVTRRAEAGLAREGCPVEVLNAGTAAYSTDQELLYYRSEGAALSPDAVLVFVYHNDVMANVERNHWGAPKPLLEWDGERMVPVNTPLTRLRASSPPAAPAPPPPPRGSVAWEWLVDRLRRGAPRAYARLAGAGLVPPIVPGEVDATLLVYDRERRAAVEAAWIATSRILRTLQRETADRGARLALVYVPARFEVLDRDWELTRMRYALGPTWDRSLVTGRLAAVAGKLELPLLDLTPALREASRGGWRSPYHTYDGHWNALGHRAAAGATAGFLRRLGWLPACRPR